MLEIFLIAVSLALDAFAVSVSSGIAIPGFGWRQAARMGLWFGFFQFMMPLLGWFLGSSVSGYIEAVDHWVAFVLLVWAYLRMLSRNTGRRYAENQKFLQFWRPWGGRLRGVIQRLQSGKDYCYFKCPHCGQKVRVPRGRGKIEITCPSCRQTFVKRT